MDTKKLDTLVKDFVIATDQAQKEKLAHTIWDEAAAAGVFPASIAGLYAARGQKKCAGFTVPALNLRTLTYDLARAVFRAAKKINAGAFIFEIARSEMGYTDQKPFEYTTVCLAAALREGHKGPVFVQGDHFQVNAKKYKEDPIKEMDGLKKLIKEAIEAGFYNIDIDSSTLVELDKADLMEEQKLNFEVCAQMTQHIRSLEPQGVEISIGGEIGEVGTKNSTPEDLAAFMKGYLEKIGKGAKGISKISVQTGTSHGGVVLPDGSIAKVKLDFDTLKVISEVARRDYGMAGAVQHGASTLPDDAFHKFPEMETAEVHLATQFQNMIFDSKYMPQELREKMYAWVKENLKAERKSDMTDEQFIYSARKKVLGPFKKDLMSLPQETRDKIGKELEDKFTFLFDQLKIKDTKKLVDQYIKQTKTQKKFSGHDAKAEQFDGAD